MEGRALKRVLGWGQGAGRHLDGVSPDYYPCPLTDSQCVDRQSQASYPDPMTQAAFDLGELASPVSQALTKFPTTRYQGSKRKLLPFLHEACKDYSFCSVLDLYSGTGSVSLMFRHMGKIVTANDYMLYNAVSAKVLLTSTSEKLASIDFEQLLDRAFLSEGSHRTAVTENFAGIYFRHEENIEIDIFCHNLGKFCENEANLLIYLMGQAMLMKRPYNLFHRANLEMRTKDVQRSFGNAKTWETSFQDHMRKLAKNLNKCPFEGPFGEAHSINTSSLTDFRVDPDLIYLDPPYLNKAGVAVDYSGFYHFLDGLVDYDLFYEGNEKYPHKPIALKPSRWKSAKGGLDEVRAVTKRWPKAILAISYRGDGQPSIDDLKQVLCEEGYSTVQHSTVEYKYALSKNTDATEDLIVATRKSQKPLE